MSIFSELGMSIFLIWCVWDLVKRTSFRIIIHGLYLKYVFKVVGNINTTTGLMTHLSKSHAIDRHA